MNRLAWLFALAMIGSGCTSPSKPALDPSIRAELDKAATPGSQKAPAPVQEALLPPLRMEMPAVRGQPPEQRFDLAVSNAPAAQVFMSIVSGTRYSMLVHPQVSGTITINLKDATIVETLNAIRELYGYEYRIDGNRIFIQPIAIQTRVFNVNYLIGQRLGRSDIRVTSGSVSDVPGVGGAAPAAPGTTTPAPPAGTPGPTPSSISDSSRIQTETRNDFWQDLERTLRQIVGTEPGRSVVVNPQAGVVVVRAMPAELRGVDTYLRAIRSSVERQVVLEAKIIEVTLNSQYQAGINWAAFSSGGLSVGQASPGTALTPRGGSAQVVATGSSSITSNAAGGLSVAAPALSAIPGRDFVNHNLPGASLFGLAFQTRNFAALLSFLESQGAVQVLSSPRIATINNQKAVLKVGTDQFFLTSISGASTNTTTTTTGATTPAFPSITMRPFFSGVALDITPQINEDSEIILHIHPSVSDVQTDNRTVDLGAAFGGQVSLPVARSNVSETDSIVRVIDGNIVAIGGLMKVDVQNSKSGLPGTQDGPLDAVFNSNTRTLVKKELVILIKPTVVHGGADSADEARQARERILNLLPAQPERR